MEFEDIYVSANKLYPFAPSEPMTVLYGNLEKKLIDIVVFKKSVNKIKGSIACFKEENRKSEKNTKIYRQ